MPVFTTIVLFYVDDKLQIQVNNNMPDFHGKERILSDIADSTLNVASLECKNNLEKYTHIICVGKISISGITSTKNNSWDITAMEKNIGFAREIFRPCNHIILPSSIREEIETSIREESSKSNRSKIRNPSGQLVVDKLFYYDSERKLDRKFNHVNITNFINIVNMNVFANPEISIVTGSSTGSSDDQPHSLFNTIKLNTEDKEHVINVLTETNFFNKLNQIIYWKIPSMDIVMLNNLNNQSKKFRELFIKILTDGALLKPSIVQQFVFIHSNVTMNFDHFDLLKYCSEVVTIEYFVDKPKLLDQLIANIRLTFEMIKSCMRD